MGYANRSPMVIEAISYPVKAKTDAIPSQSGKQLIFMGATVQNRAGASNFVGIGFKVDNSRWKAGQWDDSETASYIEDTTDAQDVGANDFALTTTTNNDGFVIQSLDKFGIVALQVGTAQAGSPVYEYTYWNGSSWTALTTIEVPTSYTVAEHTIAFFAPTDWAALAAADAPVATDGLTAGYYAIRLRATTAPSTAPLATQIWVAKVYDFKEDVSDNGLINFTPEDPINGIALHGGESIIPYYKTAHADNVVTVRYAIRG